MPTYASPTFAATYQGLCDKIADTLNRQDLTAAIPDFTVLATARISRDMARVRHPGAIVRAQAEVTDNYAILPTNYISIYQLADKDTQSSMVYLTTDQSITIQSQGWTPPDNDSVSKATYYTIIGDTIRLYPAPTTAAPTELDLWFFGVLPGLSTTNTTNWVLTKYPDLYLYGSLLHTAPYLKNDERIALWDGLYGRILSDIEVEADRATRPQSKLVAARRGF